MAHIRVQRLGAGGRKEHGAHQRQTGGVIRTEQELDAVVRVECGEHGPVVADGYHADDRQEREPDHHHRAEDLADRFGAARLHGEQDHDDHRGDHHRQILVLGEQMLQRRQRLQPSTADEIDTAGVSTESARKAAPPSMAGMTSHAPYLRINEYRAKMILQKRTSKHPNSHHT